MRAVRWWQKCIQRSLEAPRTFATSSPSLQQRVSVAQLQGLQGAAAQDVDLYGWVRSVRKQKKVAFAAVGDGSTIQSVQAVLKPEEASSLTIGAAVRLSGKWKLSRGKGQSHELEVHQVEILGDNDAEHNPLQPKYQTPEFLRTISHLRPRVPANALLLRARSQVITSLTNWFNHQGFVQTHTPVITSSDCEGAGEVFTVSSDSSTFSDQTHTPGHIAKREDFFRTPKYLTVSAQLHLEALAQAVDKVWTLSPAFRAEKSDTPRHLSEFYMLEAEQCFVDDLDSIMDIVEGALAATAKDLLQSRAGAELLEVRGSQNDSTDSTTADPADLLQQRWRALANGAWPRITYTQAIDFLQSEVAAGKTSFALKPTYEAGLQAEHERYLASNIGPPESPVFITDYPREQKAFYMSPSLSTRRSKGTEDTASCFDLLVPELCELVGGSMREYRLADLQAAMKAKGVVGENLEWYSDLRKYGSVPHGGFGMGFDRLMCYLTGVGNVRDVVAFPRWYGRCDC